MHGPTNPKFVNITSCYTAPDAPSKEWPYTTLH